MMDGSHGLGTVWGICRGVLGVLDGLSVREMQHQGHRLNLHLHLTLLVSGNRPTGGEITGDQGALIREGIRLKGCD